MAATVNDPRPFGLQGPVVVRELAVNASANVIDTPSAPTITSGASAASSTEPQGSLWLQTDGAGQAFTSVDGAGNWTRLAQVTAEPDPGDAAAIPVDGSSVIAITTAAAEANTLAIPSFLGQRILLVCDVYAVGDREITAASAINAAGNTIMTFGAARDCIELVAIQLAGVLAWEISFNNGVALS